MPLNLYFSCLLNLFQSPFSALVKQNSESTPMLHSLKSPENVFLLQYLAIFTQILRLVFLSTKQFHPIWIDQTTSFGHSLSSFPIYLQSRSSRPPSHPSIFLTTKFLLLSARLWLGYCCPNLHWARPNLGPGTFSSFLPVKNDLLWFSREIYIPTLVKK